LQVLHVQYRFLLLAVQIEQNTPLSRTVAVEDDSAAETGVLGWIIVYRSGSMIWGGSASGGACLAKRD